MTADLSSNTSDVSGTRTLVDLMMMRARVSPHRQALTFLVDGESVEASLTYAQLDHKARLIATALRRMHLEGERVLLLYPAGLDYVAALFGCLYAGAVGVPSYPPKLGRTMPRLESIILDSGAKAALTTSSVMAKLDHLLRELPFLSSLRWLATDSASESIAEEAADWTAPELSPNSLAFLQYTSGSTSDPKGVMLTHANVLSNELMIKQAFDQSENSIVFGWLPFYHDMGLMGNVLQPIYLGARSILISPIAFLQRPVRWLQGISRYRATTSGGPNFAYELCVQKIREEERGRLDLSSWRVAFNGAEPIRAATIDSFAAAFQSCGFDKEAFRPCYGLAEATLLVSTGSGLSIRKFDSKSLERGTALDSGRTESERPLVGSGRVAGDQTVIIVDSETMTECAPDRVGEIWVKGPSIAQGYWNRPELSEHTFAARVAGSGDGPFLRTGDLGFFKGGELFVTGRLKDLIIVRGLNHYPQDIELTAARCHSGLRQGCGAAFSLEMSDQERLVIVQELERHPDATPEALAEEIRRSVIEQHDVEPYSVVLVKAGSIPKTSSGKIRRVESRNRFIAGEFEVIYQWVQRIDAAASIELPASIDSIEEIELFLVTQIANMTGVEPDEVDLSKPLASYGLDSIAAVSLAHAIESALGVQVKAGSLLDGGSLIELVRGIEKRAGTETAASLSFEPATTEDLSHGQQALCFLQELVPGSAALNLSSAVRVKGELNVGKLSEALQHLTDRHSMLRSTYAESGGRLVRRTEPTAIVDFQAESAEGWSDDQLKTRLSALAHEPFELDRGPLFRARLFTISPSEHVLLIVVHHIIADLWSLGILFEELGRAYDGGAADLPPLYCDYSRFVAWQQELLASPEGETLRAYWKDHLRGELSPPNLPTDRARPRAQTHRGGLLRFSLNPALTYELKQLAQVHETTLSNLLLSAFYALLYRYTAEEDFVVGSVLTGRSKAEFAGIVGYFVNPVLLRAQLSGESQFTELMSRNRKVLTGALDHQDCPLGVLLDKLQSARDASGLALMRVMFVFQKSHLESRDEMAAFAMGWPGTRMQAGSLTLEVLDIEQRSSQADLMLMLAESEGALIGSLQHSADLFDPATIQRMAGHIETLLKGITVNPDCPVTQLPLITSAERRQILTELTNTFRAYPKGQRVHDLFEAQVTRTPDSLAVVCQDQQVTYSELNRRANRLAGYLQSKGVGPETRVVICLNRSVEMVVGLLAILKAGGTYVPLDPAYPEQRLLLIVAHANAPVLLTESESLHDAFSSVPTVVVMDREWALIAENSDADPASPTVDSNLAYTIYTSGSTGVPKGVAIEHRSTVAFLHWVRDFFTEDDLKAVLASTSICFDLSVFEIFGPLSWGGEIVMVDNALAITESRAEIQLSLINTVPSAMAELVRSEAVGDSVSTINLAGEALQANLVNQVFENSRVRRLHNLYGPTEDTTYSTFATLAGCDEQDPPIGRGIANTQVYVAGSADEPAPLGVRGEVLIAGEGLARGYLNRPDATAERFVPNPFTSEPGTRLYKTGDVGRYRADGQLEYFGRADQQVKIRGFRIELGEIENALMQHDDVKQAVVTPVTGAGGDKRLVAYVVMEEGGIGVAELRSYLKNRLPEYVVPGMFVKLDKIPLTPNGKVDRRSLPPPDGSESTEEVVEPRTQVEKDLGRIWAKVLGVQRVSIFDNFFDMGGHSLLATQFIARAKGQFSIEVPLREFLRAPTIAGLAEVVEQALARDIPKVTTTIARVSRQQHAALTADGRLVIDESLKERLR